MSSAVVKPWKFYWISNLDSDYKKIKHNLFFQTLPWWENRVWSVKNSEGVIDNNRCLSLHLLCPILCCTISAARKLAINTTILMLGCFFCFFLQLKTRQLVLEHGGFLLSHAVNFRVYSLKNKLSLAKKTYFLIIWVLNLWSKSIFK